TAIFRATAPSISGKPRRSWRWRIACARACAPGTAMTIEAVAAGPRPARLGTRLGHGRTLPIVTVLLGILAVWYAATVWLNADLQIDQFERDGTAWTTSDLVAATM